MIASLWNMHCWWHKHAGAALQCCWYLFAINKIIGLLLDVRAAGPGLFKFIVLFVYRPTNQGWLELSWNVFTDYSLNIYQVGLRFLYINTVGLAVYKRQNSRLMRLVITTFTLLQLNLSFYLCLWWNENILNYFGPFVGLQLSCMHFAVCYKQVTLLSL